MYAQRFVPALLITVVIGCGRAEDEPEPPPESPAPAPAAPRAAEAPDTTEAAFWAYLQDQNYRTWERWPGTAELYPGQEPHGMLLTTYVNSLALDALTNGSAMMPDGAIIVKENYMADSTFAAVTAMHKVAGYDPAHNDWFWAKWDPEGVAEVSGRVEMCAGCHGENAAGDYLLTQRPQR
jgi:hypothetical protein